MARKDKDLLGLEVVSLEDASVVGEVDGLIVDETRGRVAGLVVDMGLYEAKVISYDDIRTIGEDAVMLDGAGSLKPISEHPELRQIAERDVNIDDALAITDAGAIVGLVGDYYIDTASGEIKGVEVTSGEDDGEGRTYIVPADVVVRIGKDLVMLASDFTGRAVASGERL